MNFSSIINLITLMQFLLRIALKKSIFFSVFAVIPLFSVAYNLTIDKTILWNELKNYTYGGKNYENFATFSFAQHSKSLNNLPIWSENIRTNQKGTVKAVRITNVVYGKFNSMQSIQSNVEQREIELSFFPIIENGLTIAAVSFLPLVNNNGITTPVISFTISIEMEINQDKQLFKKAFASNSVLSQGQWYKLAVTKTGFHKLDKTFFEGNGISISGIDPRTIKVYGYGGGLLAQPVSSARFDDLVENSILVIGEQDGIFDVNDYVLFYGRAQNEIWKLEDNFIQREKNIYSDTTYYYLTFNQGAGSRIPMQSSVPLIASTQNKHIFCIAHEQDLVNIGRSGRQFLGEAFDKTPSQNFSFYIDGFDASEAIQMRSSVAARSYITPASFEVKGNGSLIYTHSNIPTVGSNYDSYHFKNSGPVKFSFNVNTPQVAINYAFSNPPGGANGWLDFFEINTKAKMIWYGSQVLFRQLPPTVAGGVEYTVDNVTIAGTRVFDVTNPTQLVELQLTLQGNQAKFVHNTTTLSEFVGINQNSSYAVPQFVGKVDNQNIHGLSLADALYITPVIFYKEALRLAAFHQSKGVTVNVVLLDEIYNEFSSGSQDITAIRECIRMLYEKGINNGKPLKYVTLFGRASYDYKYRISNNSNFVPTYQSIASESPIGSYCSDDYYGFLDAGEGKWDTGSNTKEGLDIGIGRLPISTETEAANVVDKIINYYQSDRMADWRNKLVFVADDEDYRTHQVDADLMAVDVTNKYSNYSVQKIWIDAYKQEVVAGGQRYPSAQKAISDAVQKGCFMINYTGHGGELGWAAERILTIEDIQSWNNDKALPLFVTATCEFSRFDDPARVSAGELVLLNAKGGSIALFTTVRLVLAFSNTILNKFLYNRVGLDSNSKIAPKSLGEIIRLTKNDYNSNDGNERNFTLLGDAVMTLAYPKYKVITEKINDKPIVNITDTLRALSKVTVSGKVLTETNVFASNYNGELTVTVYDKPTVYQTLVNDPESAPVMDFTMQNNIIYKGSTSVVDGNFTFTFIVPKDISYQYDKGKISYYATNSTIDANGNNQNFLVGGTNDSIAEDKLGPEISLFMDDYKFVNGGLTKENTLFIAKLFDVNGINTIGRGIGRELSLTIDGNNAKAIPVNDYYKAKINSYQEGEVKYQLTDLAPGKHTVTLKAWDTYNNSNETTLEFYVANSEELTLKHVLNYPNPFNGNTTFHFDHNRVGEQLKVMVQIFTISGKLVKTLSTETIQASTHFDQLSWNGLDDFGDKLANGVYVYKVKVQGETGGKAEYIQKLVILN